jgi:methanogenic corrinoid protein MtbC1
VVTYLGPDTPVATIQQALSDVEARLVVIAAVATQRFSAAQSELTELARHVPVALAGSGATDGLARATGASLLEGDPVSAAERVADERR